MHTLSTRLRPEASRSVVAPTGQPGSVSFCSPPARGLSVASSHCRQCWWSRPSSVAVPSSSKSPPVGTRLLKTRAGFRQACPALNKHTHLCAPTFHPRRSGTTGTASSQRRQGASAGALGPGLGGSARVASRTVAGEGPAFRSASGAGLLATLVASSAASRPTPGSSGSGATPSGGRARPPGGRAACEPATRGRGGGKRGTGSAARASGG